MSNSFGLSKVECSFLVFLSPQRREGGGVPTQESFQSFPKPYICEYLCLNVFCLYVFMYSNTDIRIESEYDIRQTYQFEASLKKIGKNRCFQFVHI